MQCLPVSYRPLFPSTACLADAPAPLGPSLVRAAGWPEAAAPNYVLQQAAK